MKKVFVVLALIFAMVAFVGCGRSAKIDETFIHVADDSFDELVIVHDGSNVSVTIDGKSYDAKMQDENKILVEEKYTILETYCDSEENPEYRRLSKAFDYNT